MSLKKEIEELREKVKEFHNKANKIGWFEQHIFNVIGEVEYHKYDNIQGQLNEKEATLKERMKWLDRLSEMDHAMVLAIDKPKEGTPIITWNYSLAFIRNILKELKDLEGTKNE